MRPWFSAIALISGLAGSSLGAMPGGHFTSGPSRVALIELYTSEGCSSCPPAEKWLSARRDDPQLWQRFVPVSFHVTYWDHLGWIDQLAKPEFTERQHAYAAAWQSPSVYTPCFVHDGTEGQPSEEGKTPAAAAGQLTLQSTDGETWELTFLPAGAPPRRLDGHIALLGEGIVSKVRAGENKGRTLAHDFVALTLVEAPLKPHGADGALTAVFHSKGTSLGAGVHSIAAWVTPEGELGSIQATGGDLPESAR